MRSETRDSKEEHTKSSNFENLAASSTLSGVRNDRLAAEDGNTVGAVFPLFPAAFRPLFLRLFVCVGMSLDVGVQLLPKKAVKRATFIGRRGRGGWHVCVYGSPLRG